MGHSTLNKWLKAFGDAAVVSGKMAELVNEIERLRRELRTVMETREILKKQRLSSRAKAMRVSFTDDCRGPLLWAWLSDRTNENRGPIAPRRYQNCRAD